MANFYVNTSGEKVDEFTTCMNNFVPKIIVTGLSPNQQVTFSKGSTIQTVTANAQGVVEYIIYSYGMWTVQSSSWSETEDVLVDTIKYYRINKS